MEIGKDDNHVRSVIGRSGFVLVYVGASWCKPCKRVYPQIEQLNVKDEVTKLYVDVDEIDVFTVAKMPTFFLYENGDVVDQYEGSNVDEVWDMICRHVSELGEDDIDF